jgi:hypothetical protein
MWEKIVNSLNDVRIIDFSYDDEHVLDRVSIKMPFYNEAVKIANIFYDSKIRPMSIEVEGDFLYVDWHVKGNFILSNKGEEIRLVNELIRYIKSLGFKGNISKFGYLIDVHPLGDDKENLLGSAVIDPKFSVENFNFEGKIKVICESEDIFK